jgi:hypothetical protein
MVRKCGDKGRVYDEGKNMREIKMRKTKRNVDQKKTSCSELD